MSDLLSYAFMREALLAAVLVGLCAPLVGTYLVQRRMSLIGDGMGHVALAGVAIGVLLHASPILTALIAAVVAACIIEFIRLRGTTNADVALAVMFYGGIAAAVVAERGVAQSQDGGDAHEQPWPFFNVARLDLITAR